MTTYTTAEQLGALLPGTLITPTNGSRMNTAYRAHDGHFKLCGGINQWAAADLLALNREWVEVRPQADWPDEVLEVAKQELDDMEVLLDAVLLDALGPRLDAPGCTRCTGTGYITCAGVHPDKAIACYVCNIPARRSA